MVERLDDVEIERRLPIWYALADLFLDTDPLLFVDHIAETIRRQCYSREEAEEILRWEVRPALYWNLLDTAGEWGSWPEEYVRERILDTYGKRSDRLILGEKRFFPAQAWAAVVARL